MLFLTDIFECRILACKQDWAPPGIQTIRMQSHRIRTNGRT